MKQIIHSASPIRLADGSRPFRITLSGITYPDPAYRMHGAGSSVNRLEYLVSGRIKVSIDGKVLYPKPGDMWLLTEGHHHFYESDTETPCHKIFCNFRGALATEYLRTLGFPAGCVISAPEMRGVMEEIVSLVGGRGEAGALDALFLLMRVLWDLQAKQDAPNAGEDGRVRTLRRAIEERQGVINLCEMASAVGLSVSQTVRMFRAARGITPTEYAALERLSAAKRLLGESGIPISELAQMLGYSDEYNFSRAFKRGTGITPAAWRKKARNG